MSDEQHEHVLAHIVVHPEIVFHAPKDSPLGRDVAHRVMREVVDLANRIVAEYPELERCPEMFESGDAAIEYLDKMEEARLQEKVALDAAMRAFHESMAGRATVSDDEIQRWLENGGSSDAE